MYSVKTFKDLVQRFNANKDPRKGETLLEAIDTVAAHLIHEVVLGFLELNDIVYALDDDDDDGEKVLQPLLTDPWN